MSSKRIVAIFLEDADRADKLAADLTQAGIDPLISRTADEFHKVLNYQRVDLVVIENDLPGFLTGLEILERLTSNLLRPPTILLADSNAEVQRRTSQLEVETLVPRAATVEALKTAIANLLATRTHSRTVIPPKALKLVAQSDVIQPLPQVLVKICGCLNDQAASIPELAKDISVDPKITAELLKITNSAAFGLNNKVTKASEAVKILGIRRTVSLVMSASIIQNQTGLLKTVPQSIRKWYYQRSVLIAGTAAAFAQNLEQVSPETAQILGLLQDLGILVMAHAFGPIYQQLIQRVQEVGQLRLEIAEKQEFEMTHADVSAALLLKWDLPQALVSMVAKHHDRDMPAACSDTEQRFIRTMRIGEAVANLSDKFFPQRHQRLCALLSTYAGDKADRCKECLAEGVSKAVAFGRIFSVPVPDEAALGALLDKIQAAGEETAPELPPGREILVIEHEAAILEMITDIAHSVGLEVLACNDGAGAKELAPRAAAILCDVHLHDERGSDVVRELRRNQFTGPVIFVSDDRTRGTIADCIDAGMTDFLPKPIDADALRQKLSKHLGTVVDRQSAGKCTVAARVNTK